MACCPLLGLNLNGRDRGEFRCELHMYLGTRYFGNGVCLIYEAEEGISGPRYKGEISFVTTSSGAECNPCHATGEGKRLYQIAKRLGASSLSWVKPSE